MCLSADRESERRRNSGSPLPTAITCAQNRWAALGVYATQGFLAIDNNAAERALKRVTIGRKNRLFAVPARSQLGRVQ